MSNILIINHILRRLDDEIRIKPSALRSFSGRPHVSESERVCFVFVCSIEILQRIQSIFEMDFQRQQRTFFHKCISISSWHKHSHNESSEISPK